MANTNTTFARSLLYSCNSPTIVRTTSLKHLLYYLYDLITIDYLVCELFLQFQALRDFNIGNSISIIELNIKKN